MTLHPAHEETTDAAGDLAGTIARNLAAVRERIDAAARQAGRDPADVHLIAVSKTKPPEAVLAAFRAGQVRFGENRVQEALDKIDAVGPGPEWHLIGHLQSNKARHVPGRFAAVHSLDSEKLANALHRHADAAGVDLPVLVQLNTEQEATKAGLEDEAALRRLLAHVRSACPRLRLTGLMTIPPPDLGEAETRRIYAHLRELLATLRPEFGLGEEFRELSMGMSHDYPWAIAEGATLVRVGTAIFGARS